MYNLHERVELIKERYGVSISVSSLQQFYHKNRVGYRSANIVKRRAYENKAELGPKRI